MPASDLPLLIDAARAAGRVALDHWKGDPQIWTKPDASPVSAADLEVDTALRETLLAARPDYGWISEETPDDPERRAADRVFIIDPIDGTRAFLDGAGNWAQSLAVAEHGRITAAVVGMPARDRMFQAALGQGAFLNGDPMSPSRASRPEGASLLAARTVYRPENWDGAVPAFDRQFRSSLAYRLCLVGQGRFDAMTMLRPAWEWDIAAGALIAGEAGARVTDRRGAPLTFNSPGRQADGVLAAGPDLHMSILRRLA